MRFRRSKQAIVFTLAGVVAVSPFAGALAATVGTQAPSATAAAKPAFFQPTALGKVNLTANSAVQLKRVTAFQGDEGKTFYYIATVYNNGNTELDFNYYWFRVRSNNGAKYSLQMVPGKEFDRVPANSKKDFHFYVTTPSNITGSDLKLEVIKWDFNAANFESKLGEIGIPKTYKNVSPAYAVQNVLVNEFPIQASVTRSTLTKDKQYQYLSLTLEISNQGTKAITFPEFTMFLKTKTGLLYPLQTDDLKDLSINPRDTKKIDLVATVPVTVPVDFSQLVWTQTAAKESSSVVLPLAFFLIPPASEIVSAEPTTGKKTVTMNDKNVDVFVKSAKSQTVSDNHNVTITLGFENQDNSSTPVPAYDLTIRTKEGLSYTVDSAALKDVVLAPKVTKEVALTAVLPSIVDPNGLTLEITEAKDPDSKIPIQKLPVAAFVVAFTVDRTYKLGDVYTYSDDKGTYDITVSKVQRLPWEADDVVAVYLDVVNNGSSPIPVPQWNGSMWFDGVEGKKIETKRISLDYEISIPAKSRSQIVYLGRIPYTYSYKDVQFELSEKVNDTTSTKVVGISDTVTQNQEFSLIPLNGQHTIDTVGKRAAVSQKELRVYNGETTDLYYGLYEMVNLEPRLVEPGQLAGYYRTVNGEFYPAELTQITKKVSPNGKLLLSAKAELPKGVDASNLQLVVGLGVTGDKLTKGTEKSDALVEAVAFELTDPSTTVSTGFKNLTLLPYTLSLSDITAMPAELTFKYNLSIANGYEMYPNDTKLHFEFKNGNTDEVIRKTFDLNVSGGLQLGEGTANIPLSGLKGESYRDYTLTLYAELNGFKIPLAKSTYNWLEVNN